MLTRFTDPNKYLSMVRFGAELLQSGVSILEILLGSSKFSFKLSTSLDNEMKWNKLNFGSHVLRRSRAFTNKNETLIPY